MSTSGNGGDAAKAARNALLASLKTAHDAYYAAEISRIANEERFLKQVQGRTTVKALANANASSAKLLLVNDINTFLTG